MTDFLSLIHSRLLPAVAPLGFDLVSSQAGGDFDNATATLAADDVLVRVYRERSRIHVSFASAAKPDESFDSAVVIELLGISRNGGFYSEDLESTVEGLAKLLITFWDELRLSFNRDHFTQTQSKLVEIEKAQDVARWGA